MVSTPSQRNQNAINMEIGYKRVSTTDQNVDRQLEGIKLDKIFVEYASGKNTTDRPVFKEMMEFIREGDILYVHSIDRFGRSLKDLIDNIDYLVNVKKVSIKFVNENMTLSSKKDSITMLHLHMLAVYYQFELSRIKERALEGIAIAKSKGKYKGRTPLKPEIVQKIKELLDAGVKQSRIASDLKISKSSIIRYKKKREEELNSSAD